MQLPAVRRVSGPGGSLRGFEVQAPVRVGGGGVLRAHRDICSPGPAVCTVAIEGDFRAMRRQCVLVGFAGVLGGN